MINDEGNPLVSVGLTPNDCLPFTHNALFELASKAWKSISLGFAVFFVISAMTFDLILKPFARILSLALITMFVFAMLVTRRFVK